MDKITIYILRSTFVIRKCKIKLNQSIFHFQLICVDDLTKTISWLILLQCTYFNLTSALQYSETYLMFFLF